MESNLVCNHTNDKQNRTTMTRESDLLITSMIVSVSALESVRKTIDIILCCRFFNALQT